MGDGSRRSGGSAGSVVVVKYLAAVTAVILAVAVSPGARPPAAAQAAPDLPAVTDFHWGVATSGFQVEGANPDSNWKRYVDATAPTGQVDPVGDAVDFWNRYREDIANAAAMGVNTFRLSVEWARIEPAPGEYDAEALAHYPRIISQNRA
ncbi:MAG: family 1 glycosylhydrolase, partial [Corynebacterium sp.]|uniref:family 1 glycosylhydrolase n=1 Tax=Corynebacterium sp. TaxID=1720 RepID=UPI0026497015